MSIKELILFTKNLRAQIDFYSNVLGFQLIQQSESSAHLKMGESVLIWQQHDQATPYHFALNIPSNQEQEALRWLQDRVNLIQHNGRDIVDFKSWNAKAIYFYDADNSIVEFIARKNLSKNLPRPFSSESIFNISEIGIGAKDTEPIIEFLIKRLHMPAYREISSRFTAIGNETGLFICVDRIKKKWFPSMDEVFPSPFRITMEYKGRKFNLEYKDELLTQRIAG